MTEKLQVRMTNCPYADGCIITSFDPSYSVCKDYRICSIYKRKEYEKAEAILRGEMRK